MDGISPGQRNRIWAMAGQAGIDKDQLHDLVRGATGKESIRLLSRREAAEVIDRLAALTGAPAVRTAAVPAAGGRTIRMKLASRRQVWKIRQLEAQLGWGGDPGRLRGFLRRMAQTDDLQWLTFYDAGKVIEAMKAMAERIPEGAQGYDRPSAHR